MNEKLLFIKMLLVILTYSVYARLYYKLIIRWAKNDTDKYIICWKAYAEMKKHYNEDATLLLINPDTYFHYDIETGKAVTLEFKELRKDD